MTARKKQVRALDDPVVLDRVAVIFRAALARKAAGEAAEAVQPHLEQPHPTRQEAEAS